MMIWYYLPVLVWLTSASGTEGLNFLLVTQPLSSHIIMYNRFGTALIRQGHTVSMVLPSNVETSNINSDIELFIYEGVGETNILSSPAVSEIFIKLKFASSFMDYLNMFNIDDVITPTMIEECKLLMDDKDLRDRINNKKFDFAILDHIGFSCVMNYPVSLGLDYFLFSVPLFTWYSRIPDLPSFCPETNAGQYTDDMTFSERMVNTFYHAIAVYMLKTTNPVDLTKYPPGRPILDLSEIQANAVFWFLLSDQALSFPSPQMPNMVSIGDIMVAEGKPLPDEFQQFMDMSPEGVILISFGSYFEFLPSEIIDKLCAALAGISQKIIWKSKSQPPCAEVLKDRMKVVSWMPQNNILAHPNLKLFLTHCGLNSMLEAVYHAKPMLGFPIALDQNQNAMILQAKHYGLQVDLTDFTIEEIINKIQRIIGNEEFQKGIQFGSSLIRDKPEPADERIAYWVEHVAKHGADHLRTSAHKLNILQFLMIDVVLAYVAIAFSLIIVILLMLCCLWRCFKKCCCAKARKQKQQ